jgi:Anti-sigma factor NepR
MPDATVMGNMHKRQGDRDKGQFNVQSQDMYRFSHMPSRPTAQDLIEEKLRAFYDEVSQEPIPERIEVLLRQLDRVQHNRKPD